MNNKDEQCEKSMTQKSNPKSSMVLGLDIYGVQDKSQV